MSDEYMQMNGAVSRHTPNPNVVAQNKSTKAGVPLGKQSRVAPCDVEAIASKARIQLQNPPNNAVTGRTKLVGKCLDCDETVTVSIARMRVNSVPCACPQKNLALWGDPHVHDAHTWAQAFHQLKITSEIELKGKAWSVFRTLSDRSLLDKIEQCSRELFSHDCFVIERKTLWHKQSLENLVNALRKYEYLSDAPQHLVTAYEKVAQDPQCIEFLAANPQVSKQKKRSATTKSERHYNFLANAISNAAQRKTYDSLSGFCKANEHPLAAFLHGKQKQKQIEWPTRKLRKFSLLDLFKRYCQRYALFPNEQLWLRERPNRRATDETWIALLKDERRRQKLLFDKDVKNLGDLWAMSGGGLATRFKNWLAKTYPRAPEREALRKQICKAAGLDEPPRDWTGFTVEDVIREVTDEGIESYTVFLVKRWDIYKWLLKDEAKERHGEFMAAMGWHGYWCTEALADRVFGSSFEAVVASVAKSLGISAKYQVRPFVGSRFRADFLFEACAWGEAWQFNPLLSRPEYKQRRAKPYLKTRAEKELRYAGLVAPLISFEIEQYFGRPVLDFARYCERTLRTHFRIQGKLSEEDLKKCSRIRQRSLKDMERDRQVWSQLAFSLPSRCVVLVEKAIPDVINAEFDKDVLIALRKSDGDVREFLKYIQRIQGGWILNRPHSHHASRLYFSDVGFGTPHLSLVAAMVDRNDYLNTGSATF